MYTSIILSNIRYIYILEPIINVYAYVCIIEAYYTQLPISCSLDLELVLETIYTC